jgi:HK97 family phage major capsid protein
MNLSNAAILEISELSYRAEELARGSAGERAQSTVLLQRIANIRQVGISSDEMRGKYAGALSDSLTVRKPSEEYRGRFEAYVAGRLGDQELRDFLAGTQSVSFTQGAGGGFLVPLEYDPKVREAMAQTDPLFDEGVTDFSMAGSDTLQPSIVSGWDLSSIAAQSVAEAAQQNPQSVPAAKGGVLAANKIFRVSLAATYEAEIDIPGFADKVVRASSVALARQIGRSVIAGKGMTDIAGVSGAIPIGAVQAAPTKLAATDITNLFFSVDRWYRAQPKCGWLLNDAVYKQVRNATDSQGRPLLDLQDEKEKLLGKPIYVTPSLGTPASLGVAGAMVFGDLSALVIRASRVSVQRHLELAQVDITRGEALWVGRCRADATFFDPSSGSNPPLKLMVVN